MPAQNASPLDEIQYRRPDIIQWWVNDFGGQPMDENMIHRYLAESPFFDYSTKNGLHFTQARGAPAEFELVKDRRRLEEDLARHVGSEYIIVGEPQTVKDGQKSGVWNIRKQQRDRRRTADGRVEEDLTTLGTYYIVGEDMYQAPSVGDIVGNRLLSATTSLSKFFDTASGLPSFSPTAGYTYLPQSAQQTHPGTSSQASPSRSREGSVAPPPALDAQSLRSNSIAPPSTNLPTSTQSQDARLLAQSFQMTLEFADEYMDENPLTGEPGHFSFTSSLAAVKKRKAAEEEAAALAAKAKEQRLAQQSGTSASSAMKTEKVATPPAVMTDAKTSLVAKENLKERRGSRMGERSRRKKSRANVGSLAGGSAEGAAG